MLRTTSIDSVLSTAFIWIMAGINHLTKDLTAYRKHDKRAKGITYICRRRDSNNDISITNYTLYMKKITLLWMILCIFNISFTSAKDNKPVSYDVSSEYEVVKIAKKVPNNVKKAIYKELTYPEYAEQKNMEGQVYLRITVDEDNMLKVIGMNATSPYLGGYVKHKLKSTQIKNPGTKPGQVYIMKVDFEMI